MSGMSKSREKFNIQFSLLSGTTADTDIALTGIATEDEIIFVGEFATAAAIATLTDRTSTVSITAAGVIQSTANTSSNQLLVVWCDVSK